MAEKFSVAAERVAFCCPHVEKPASPVRVWTTGMGNMNKRNSVRPAAGLAGLLLPALLLAHEPEVMQEQVVFSCFAQFYLILCCSA